MIIKVKTEEIEELGVIKACILGYLREFKEVKYFEIAEDFGMTSQSIKNHIDMLELKGKVAKRKGEKSYRTVGVSICEVDKILQRNTY